jgi:hypothetical protein
MKCIVMLTLLLAACTGERNPENSALCGIAMVGSGAMVLDHFQTGTTVLTEAPDELTRGVVPIRVIGYGTSRALAAQGPEGVVLGYEGAGFPTIPGFAVALVDDSSEVLRGVLVFEAAGRVDYPQLGTVSSATSTLPLYGMLIRWSEVSEPRCPLFADITDTTST